MSQMQLDELPAVSPPFSPLSFSFSECASSPAVSSPDKSDQDESSSSRQLHFQLSSLADEGREMLERLPSLHAQALRDDTCTLNSPVAEALRKVALASHEHVDSHSSSSARAVSQLTTSGPLVRVHELVDEGTSLIEALPSPHAKEVSNDIKRSNAPVARAVRAAILSTPCCSSLGICMLAGWRRL